MNRSTTEIAEIGRKRSTRKKKAMSANRNMLALVFFLLSSLTIGGQNQEPHKQASTIEPLPRDLEIQLALSSLPGHLRDNATVYVLNPDKGFEVARNGTNGFHALVARTGDDGMRGSWPLTDYPDDILYLDRLCKIKKTWCLPKSGSE